MKFVRRENGHEGQRDRDNLEEDILPTVSQDDSVKLLMYYQIQVQFFVIYEAVLVENQQTARMAVLIQSFWFSVVKIPGNGNCMFGSASHQLFDHKLSSLAAQSARLRAEVVVYIRQHFERFRPAIISRVIEDNEASFWKVTMTEAILNERVAKFLDNSLSKSGYYGGQESLIAISELYRVNVFVIREQGMFSFVNDFNTQYERTISLAYRFGFFSVFQTTKKYNHYDSVVSII